MDNPVFSVVIPTRDRSETLRSTIQTCERQDFESYEIIVFDNYSGPMTKEIADATVSNKVRYYRSSDPLSMQDSWNEAYGYARGDYVIFLGDDDGLMPFALSTLEKIFRAHSVDAVSWTCGLYTWPNMTSAADANYINLSLINTGEVVDSISQIKDVLAGRKLADCLPNVYHGAARRTVLEDIRKKAGFVFHGVHPDTFSSFAVAYTAGHHLFTNLPMSMTGFSSRSGNVAFTQDRNKSDVGRMIAAENARAAVAYHPWVPSIASPLCVVADSFLQVKGRLFPDDRRLSFDRKAFLRQLMCSLPVETVEEWQTARDAVFATLSDDLPLQFWFNRFEATLTRHLHPKLQRAPEQFGPMGNYLHLDAAALRIHNVAAAVETMAALLGFGRRRFDVRVPKRRKKSFLSIKLFLTK